MDFLALSKARNRGLRYYRDVIRHLLVGCRYEAACVDRPWRDGPYHGVSVVRHNTRIWIMGEVVKGSHATLEDGSDLLRVKYHFYSFNRHNRIQRQTNQHCELHALMIE
jgi:hypothetical protein